MTFKVGPKRKYPTMKWKSWGPRICPHCNYPDCLHARQVGACPIDIRMGQLEKDMKEGG
jgi:hypothetical protein